MQQPTSKDSVWISIPCFNEGSVIGDVVATVRESYPNVVVVDDGSSDDSAMHAARAGAHVVQHPINLGQGAALQTGITYALNAGASYVVTFDADGQHRVEDVAAMLVHLRENDLDVVLGSRFLGTTEGMPASRKLLLKLAVAFTNVTTGVRLTDAHNGLRVMRAVFARKLRIRQDRMAHASEIISQIGKLEARFAEVPVTIAYTEYSLQKGQSAGDAGRILADLFGDWISK